MEKSLFTEWINKYFQGIVIKVVTTLNDTQKNPLTYLHRSLLRPQYSVTGKWESLSSAFTAIRADVVSMDSDLPLKKRDSLSKASGDIPKSGMKMYLNETQLTHLRLMIQTNTDESTIIAEIFKDTRKTVTGIYELCEAMFLQGLCTGYALIDNTNGNVGTGVRIDYGYKDANKKLVGVTWATSATAKPIDDLNGIIDQATMDGFTMQVIRMDKTAFNNMVKTTQFKEQYAFLMNFQGSSIPVPSQAQAQAVLTDKFGLRLEIIDRSIRYENDGVQTSYKPWQDGMVVLSQDGELGSLMYATLAEEAYPVEGVSYSKAENFILVSKYRQNQPSLAEFTTSQSRVVPVISSIESIYTLDSKTAQS